MTLRRLTPLLSTVAFVMLFLAGCGGTDSSTSPQAESPSPSSSPTGSASSEARDTGCTQVKHALGKTCVPNDPQRVVTLGYNTSLEYALALGLPVVGFDGDAAAPDHVPSYLDPGLVADATFVGDGESPDLEKVKALDPDLIIYSYDNGNYPQVSAIAPTVVLELGYSSYRDDFMAAATMLQRTDKAETFLAELDKRIAEVRDEIAPVISGKTVSVFRITADGKAEISGEGDYIAELFTELGAKRPDTQRKGYQSIGLEQIGMLDADVAYVAFGFANRDPDMIEQAEETRKEFETSPLWQTLKFVADDQIYPIDPLVFGLTGIYWAYGMLDQIEEVSAG